MTLRLSKNKFVIRMFVFLRFSFSTISIFNLSFGFFFSSFSGFLKFVSSLYAFILSYSSSLKPPENKYGVLLFSVFKDVGHQYDLKTISMYPMNQSHFPKRKT